MEQSRGLMAARLADDRPHARLGKALVRAGNVEAWLRGQGPAPPGRAHRQPVACLGFGERAYPATFLGLERPPPVLFVRGGALPDPARCVAIVGSRRASEGARMFARDLAEALAGEGLVVVSGLAFGVDAAAHRGALAGRGRTLAVLASSVDEPTPRAHAGLARRIVESGWLVSERPPDARVGPACFPRRNRIVAALAAAVVVVEAGVRSGTLSTVNWAQGLGVAVGAVPGPPLDPGCRGSNDLLRAGAHLVDSPDDVLALLDSARRAPAEPGCAVERAILAAGPGVSGSVQQWADAAERAGEGGKAALRRLIARGVLRGLPGGRLGRVLR